MKKSYVGCEVVAEYSRSLVDPMTAKSAIPANKVSNDTEYQRVYGVVVSQLCVDSNYKAMILVIQTEWKGYFLSGTRTICEQSVYHTVCLDKVKGFRVINRPVEYTGKDEPCDAVSDSMLECY